MQMITCGTACCTAEPNLLSLLNMIADFDINLRMMHVFRHQTITMVNGDQITCRTRITCKDNGSAFCCIRRDILAACTKIKTLMEFIVKLSESEVACHNRTRTRICKSADHRGKILQCHIIQTIQIIQFHQLDQALAVIQICCPALSNTHRKGIGIIDTADQITVTILKNLASVLNGFTVCIVRTECRCCRINLAILRHLRCTH